MLPPAAPAGAVALASSQRVRHRPPNCAVAAVGSYAEFEPLRQSAERACPGLALGRRSWLRRHRTVEVKQVGGVGAGRGFDVADTNADQPEAAAIGGTVDQAGHGLVDDVGALGSMRQPPAAGEQAKI